MQDPDPKCRHFVISWHFMAFWHVCQKANCITKSAFSRLFPPFRLFHRIRLLDFPALGWTIWRELKILEPNSKSSVQCREDNSTIDRNDSQLCALCLNHCIMKCECTFVMCLTISAKKKGHPLTHPSTLQVMYNSDPRAFFPGICTQPSLSQVESWPSGNLHCKSAETH